jgi:hypothetical protein
MRVHLPSPSRAQAPAKTRYAGPIPRRCEQLTMTQLKRRTMIVNTPCSPPASPL